MAAGRPHCVLKNDPVAVGVFKRAAVAIPIRVEGWHRIEAGGSHPFHGFVPGCPVRQVEDEQAIPVRRPPRRMAPGARELQVIRRTRATQHQAVEAVVVVEPIELGHAQTVAVEAQQRLEVVGRARHSQDGNDLNCLHRSMSGEGCACQSRRCG